MSVLDLINAIQAGNSQDIETHFESEMNNRIAERLDDMRAYVAKNMFNEDVDVYDYEDVITEADIVDVVITEEDIEELLQTEEFEQLDELSKNTLVSYINKAGHDVGKKLYARYHHDRDARQAHRAAPATQEKKGKPYKPQYSPWTANGNETVKKHQDAIDHIDKKTRSRRDFVSHALNKVADTPDDDKFSANFKGTDTYIKRAKKAKEHGADYDGHVAQGRKDASKESRAAKKAAKLKESVLYFMQTEEFEQLDELSKKTLGSYVKKAANDMAISHANRMVKAGEADEVDRFMNRNTSAGYQEKNDAKDNLKKALGADSASVNKHFYRSAKRAKGIDTAVKKLTKEDIDQLEENKVPAGIKLFHHDKEGKESYSIHFSAQDAQREEKRRKKMGHKVVAHSLVYGQNDEGERVNH